MRLIFMGTPDFSVPVLEALVADGYEIACVYCQPPRPAGRGKKLRVTSVHARAEAMGLPVRHPLSFKDPDVVAEFAAVGADVAVVVADVAAEVGAAPPGVGYDTMGDDIEDDDDESEYMASLGVHGDSDDFEALLDGIT